MNKKYRIRFVVSHRRGHLDEVAAHILLQMKGEELFPGVAAAKLCEYDPEIHEDGRSEEERLEDGYLFLGVGGGMFDDHPHSQHEDDCVYTKVLRYLQVDDPALARIGHEVLHEDRHGAASRFHVASLLKDMMRWGMREEAYRCVRAMIFDAHYKSQVEFQKTLDFVRTEAQAMDVVNGPTGDVLRLVWIDVCDEEDFSRAARSVEGLTASLVIKRDSRGLTYISGNKAQGIWDLRLLAEAVRELETDYTWFDEEEEQLGCDGMLYGWYHQRNAAQIFNGSLTSGYVDPSNVPMEELVGAAADFLKRVHIKGKRKVRQGR